MRFMCSFLIAGTVFVAGPATTALADFDISPTLPLTQLVTNGHDDETNQDAAGLRVFSYDLGADVNHTANDPGFNAFGGSGLPQGSELSLNVMTNLLYWNGVGQVSFGPAASGESVQLVSKTETNQVLSSFSVRTATGFQTGFLIVPVAADGSAHRHIFSTLAAGNQPTPADGVYLVEERLRLLTSESSAAPPYPGVVDSLPYFVLYNNNTEELTAFQSAINWVQTNLVPFGDFGRDHTTTVADIQAMMTALANLNDYKASHLLNDELVEGFGDIDGDGKVTNADLQGLITYLANRGTAATSVSAVPEPGSIVLFGLASIILLGRLRKTVR
jgi:PEP-CTERM motif